MIINFIIENKKGNQNKPEITHVHNHYIYDTRSNVVEGVEQTDFRPDGSSTTTRHIKKWN